MHNRGERAKKACDSRSGRRCSPCCMRAAPRDVKDWSEKLQVEAAFLKKYVSAYVGVRD